MQQLEKVLKACANRRRLAILVVLKNRDEAFVGDIAKAIRLSFRSTSRHLYVLRTAGVIEREQRSLEMWYSLVRPLHPIVERVFTLS